MKKFRFAFSIALASSAQLGIACAQGQSSFPTTSAPARSDDPNRIVCHWGQPKVGTRIGTARECHTLREWNRRQQEQRNELTRFQIERGNS